MEFKFVPNLVALGEMEGSVTLRMPSYDEKMELLDSMDLELTEEGEVSKDMLRKKSLKAMRAIGSKAKDFIIKVDLKRKSDKFKFENYDHLNYDSDGHAIINEIAGKLLSRMQLGKS